MQRAEFRMQNCGAAPQSLSELVCEEHWYDAADEIGNYNQLSFLCYKVNFAGKNLNLAKSEMRPQL